LINPILTGVSSAAQALEALFATTKASPASSSAGAFSARQGLPAGPGASPQAAPSNSSNKFAPAALSFLTALQDPESAAAGFAHGAEGAIGKDISAVGSMLEKLKNALTAGASGSASASANALSVGSAAAGALSVAWG
jgi:DNA-binding NarL/FixJ family response regulator